MTISKHKDQELKLSTISVIITSYNQADSLKEAINSVLYQTYPVYEIIICDDNSQDNSKYLIQEYEKRYPGVVKGVFQKNNRGISKNRNSGLKSVTGKYVTWLDGDDIFFPRKIEMELKKLKISIDAKWVYSQVIHTDITNRLSFQRYKRFYRGMIFDKVVSCLGVAPRNPLIDYSALKSVGFFNETLDMYEDFDLCLRISKNLKCNYCDIPLMEYRIHSNGVHKSKTQKHLENLKILKDNLHHLLRDLPETKRKKYKKQFSFNPVLQDILTKNDLENGNISQLLRRSVLYVFFSPRFFIKSNIHIAKHLIKNFILNHKN